MKKIIIKDDEQLVKENNHISTEEILQDIKDTQAEIVIMAQEAAHLEKTPLSLPSARWDHIRAESRRSGIKERYEFIEKLSAIIRGRELISQNKQKQS